MPRFSPPHPPFLQNSLSHVAFPIGEPGLLDILAGLDLEEGTGEREKESKQPRERLHLTAAVFFYKLTSAMLSHHFCHFLFVRNQSGNSGHTHGDGVGGGGNHTKAGTPGSWDLWGPSLKLPAKLPVRYVRPQTNTCLQDLSVQWEEEMHYKVMGPYAEV